MVTSNATTATASMDEPELFHNIALESPEDSDLEPKESWFNRNFPSLRWSPSSPKILKEAEEKFLNFVRTKSRGWYVDIGTINNHPCRIWTRQFGSKTVTNEGPLPLVMIHGMGAGLAFFCKNFDDLAESRPLYALDLPGFARSSRPRFSSKHEEAELQYVSALEEWRSKVGLEKMCLLGHSFGGYLAASYSLKYPNRVSHLILADPWGFPERPADLVQRYNIPWYIRGLFQIFRHFNPLATLRISGPWGERAIKRMRPELVKKFEDVFENEEQNFEIIPGYIFHCNAQDPTGESAFHSLMSGFAWAKEPMYPRLAALDPKVPLTVLYGGESWVATISQQDYETTANRTPDSYTKVQVIPNAGHHLYVDQSEEFNKEILSACKFSDEVKH